MTFHRILPGCEEGNPEAWRAFARDYTPMALQFFGVYSSLGPDACFDYWRESLRVLIANEYATLKGFSHQSEREFLVGFRAFLLERLAAKVDTTHDAADPPAPTIETLGVLLAGLPVVHQEIIFLTLAGYSKGTLEKVLRITPAIAGEGLSRLRASYAAVVDRTEDRCFWPAAWLGLSREARASEQKDCTPLRQLIRIFDGQASWYDKTPAEEHRSKCLHCLELWTSLLEVVAWDRARQPLPPDKIENLIVDIPRIPAKPRGSLFARMLGK